jgi:hypothetical protein
VAIIFLHRAFTLSKISLYIISQSASRNAVIDAWGISLDNLEESSARFPRNWKLSGDKKF